MKVVKTNSRGVVVDRNNPLHDTLPKKGEKEYRPKAQYIEVSDAAAEEITAAVADKTNRIVVDTEGNVEVITLLQRLQQMPFRRGLREVLRKFPAEVRFEIINAIGPGFAMNDMDAVHHNLNNLVVAEEHERTKQIALDLIGTEAAKRKLG